MGGTETAQEQGSTEQPIRDEQIRLLTKEDILGVTDISYEIVPVPEWHGSVRIRGLRGAERDEYEMSMVQQRGKDVKVNMVNIRAGLVARVICDQNGNRLFTDADIGLLGQKSAIALERVYERAAVLSALTDESVQVLAKNSASDRSGAPSSA